MRKLLLFFVCLGMSLTTAFSQVIFEEDFDFIPGTGVPGTYVFPSGWLLFNVDGRIPEAPVAYVNDAWERREDFIFNVGDSAMFSTSWYTPVGAADDWAFTPAITILPNTLLSWNALASDPLNRDGYEVRIMTAVPNLGNLLTSTVLLTVAAENSTWTSRFINLNAYAGQTVYIAFRNNSNDKFLLLVDDVKLEVQHPHEMQITAITRPSEYSLIPAQQPSGIRLGVDVLNQGLQACSNVRLDVEVRDALNNTVYNTTSNTVPSIAPLGTATLTAPNFVANYPSTYSIHYQVVLDEVDALPGNNLDSASIVITDTVYARDNSVVTGSLGIGAGGGGYLGNEFEILVPDTATSVSMYFTGGYTGRRFAAAIWNMIGGVPNAIVATTDTLLYPDDSARFYTLPLHGGHLLLTPGKYAVTAIEFDSTLKLGISTQLFTNNTTWIDWPGNPFGGWANSEDFGSNFARTFVVRLNLSSHSCVLNYTLNPSDETCLGCNDGSAAVTVLNSNGNVSYLWNTGDTTASVSNLAPGTYIIDVTDNNCTVTDTVVIRSCVLSSTMAFSAASCVSCNDGSASVTILNATGNVSYLWSTGDTTASVNNLLPGTYTVTISDEVCTTTVTVTIPLLSSNLKNPNINVALYPNPAKGLFFIRTTDEKGFEEGTYNIVNVLGETVLSGMITAGTNELRVNAESLAAGNYLCRLTLGEETVFRKLVIQ